MARRLLRLPPMRSWIFAVALVVGCDKTPAPASAPASAPGSAAAPASAPAVPAPAPDSWSQRRRVRHDLVIDDIQVAVEVPDGLPRDQRQPGDWNLPGPEHDLEPKVFTSTIEVSRVQSLEQARYHATLDARSKTWVRQERRADGWALTNAEPDHTNIEAITYRQAGDQYVRCKAIQSGGDNALTDHARTRALLESICDSLTIGSAAPAPGATAP